MVPAFVPALDPALDPALVPAAALDVDPLRADDDADRPILDDPLAEPLERGDLVVCDRWVMATWFIRVWDPGRGRGMRIGLDNLRSA